MFHLVTDSRCADGGPNLALISVIDESTYYHFDWTYSLMDSWSDPEPQLCSGSIADLLVDPNCCADTILLSFNQLEDLALNHPEHLI